MFDKDILLHIYAFVDATPNWGEFSKTLWKTSCFTLQPLALMQMENQTPSGLRF